jgi:nitronate monooxygenase
MTQPVTRPVLRTTACDLFKIEFPILLAGMGPTVGESNHGIAGPELVAAVSNAGGLGVLGGTGYGPDEMEAAILRIRELTDKPFGVDILLPILGPKGGAPIEKMELPNDVTLSSFIPEGHKAQVEAMRQQLKLPLVERTPRSTPSGMASGLFDPQAQIDVITGMGVPVLATGLGDPAPFMNQLRNAGTVVISLVGNVKAARRVLASGVDAIVAQGSEAGGHTGRIGTMALLPQVLDIAGDTPVIAAGGIGDGRGLAAVLAMGCVGAWCGTVFIATEEAAQDRRRKERIVEATDESTKVTRLYSGKTMRNITNPLIEAWEESGIKALPMGMQSALIAPLLRGAEAEGHEDWSMLAAGQVSGLVKSIRPAAEVVLEMATDASLLLSRASAHATGSLAAGSGGAGSLAAE